MQGFFQSSFQLSFSFDHSFITGVLHGGSTWWFTKDLIPSRSAHQDFFRGAQVFFILHSKVQFFLSYLFRWCYVILDNFPSWFMIRKLLRMRYLNPSFSSLDLSWVIFHLKPSLRNVAIVVIIYDPSFLLFHQRKKFFISSPIWSKQLFPLVAEFSPQDFEMFSISPQQAYSFCCWFPTTPFNPS